MKYLTSIFLIVINFTLFSQTEGFEKLIDKNYYFLGTKENKRHTLTFQKDSLFHITVPDNSESCWIWGEYGGRIKIDGNKILFYLSQFESNEKPEIFLLRNSKKLIRISDEKFMHEKYELKKWKK